MSLLEWYILRRMATVTFGTLIATTTIVLITQVLIRIDLLSSTGQSLLVFGKLAMLLVPSVAVIVTPFALLIGAAQTLNGMNSDSELVVIEASGGSRKIVARPLIYFGIVLSIFVFILANIVEPRANRQIRDLVIAAKADLISTAVQSGSFTEIDDNLVIQIEKKERDGTFTGVFLSDRRDNQSELLYYAKSGAITEVDGVDLFVLRDGQLQRRDVEDGNISVISFNLNALDLSAFGQGAGSAVYYPKERSTLALMNPDVNDPIFQKTPGELRNELNKRLSEWFYPIIFSVLVIFYVGKARSHRQSSFLAIAYLGGVVLLVRGVGAFATNNSGDSTFFHIMVYALPLGVTAFFSILVLLGKEIPDPQRTMDATKRIFRQAEALLPRPVQSIIHRFWRREVAAQ